MKSLLIWLTIIMGTKDARAARSIRVFAEYLDRHPEALIRRTNALSLMGQFFMFINGLVMYSLATCAGNMKCRPKRWIARLR